MENIEDGKADYILITEEGLHVAVTRQERMIVGEAIKNGFIVTINED